MVSDLGTLYLSTPVCIVLVVFRPESTCYRVVLPRQKPGVEVLSCSFSWEAESRAFPLKHVLSHTSARSISRTYLQSTRSKHIVHLTTDLEPVVSKTQYVFPNRNPLSFPNHNKKEFTSHEGSKRSNKNFSRCVNLSLIFFCPKTKYLSFLYFISLKGRTYIF